MVFQAIMKTSSVDRFEWSQNEAYIYPDENVPGT